MHTVSFLVMVVDDDGDIVWTHPQALSLSCFRTERFIFSILFYFVRFHVTDITLRLELYEARSIYQVKIAKKKEMIKAEKIGWERKMEEEGEGEEWGELRNGNKCDDRKERKWIQNIANENFEKAKSEFFHIEEWCLVCVRVCAVCSVRCRLSIFFLFSSAASSLFFLHFYWGFLRNCETLYNRWIVFILRII